MSINWSEAPDVKQRVGKLMTSIGIDWINEKRVFCFRSVNSTSRASARIWGLSRIWQQALEQKPSYIIEVISEKFDKLDTKNQDKVLIHELTHIPKTFSGALLSHRRRGKGSFTKKLHDLIVRYEKINSL